MLTMDDMKGKHFMVLEYAIAIRVKIIMFVLSLENERW